jgi:ATP sulfurylase
MRGLLEQKQQIPEKFMYPEIVEYLQAQDDLFCE